MPAKNNFVIDSLIVTPYTINVKDGGIIRPKVAAPAKVPIIIGSGYLRFRSSGIDILPTVVSVAAEDPDTAAKTVQPTILVCTRPPGSPPIHGDNPLNISSDNRVRYKISPIQINKGSAVSVHDDDDAQIVVIITSPTGREVNNSIPTHATPISARPTQTPAPRRVNKMNKKRMMIDRFSILYFSSTHLLIPNQI